MIRKLRYKLIAVLCLLTSMIGQAQTNDRHSLSIGIPNYIGLKIIDNAGNIAVNPSVDFDFNADFTTYATAVAAGGANLAPTSVTNFKDIQVFITKNTAWYIRTLSVVNSGFSGGIVIGDISVTPGSVSGLSRGTGFTSVSAGWTLRTNWRTIANGFGSTRGWSSLGFNGQDYKISVQGNESTGLHNVTVYYQLISF